MSYDAQVRLAAPLSDDEKRFIFEQRNSHHYMIFQKALVWLYAKEAALLVRARPEELLQKQGVLIGLTVAKNLLTLGAVPEDLGNAADKK